MCPPGQFPTLSEIYFTMCTVYISLYPEQNFQPLVKYISQYAQSIYVIISRTKYPTIGDEIYLTMCTVQALKLQRVDWTVPMDTQVFMIRMKIFLSLWFNPGGYGRSSSGRYRRLQYYVRRAINRFVKIKQILCDWQTNIK